MAMYLWGGSQNSTTQDLITNARLNSNSYGLFKGTSGQEDNLTLAYNATGALLFQPNVAPPAGAGSTGTLQFKDVNANLQAFVQSNGVAQFAGLIVTGAASISTLAGSTGTSFSNILVSQTASVAIMVSGSGIILGNNIALQGMNAAGAFRTIAYIDTNTPADLIFVQPAATGFIQWQNFAQTFNNMTLDNSGDLGVRGAASITGALFAGGAASLGAALNVGTGLIVGGVSSLGGLLNVSANGINTTGNAVVNGFTANANANLTTVLVGSNVGFYGVTAQVQQTSGANLTNNVTAGGVTDTIANYTDLTTYANDAAAIRNDIYQLARKIKQINDGLRTYGLFT